MTIAERCVPHHKYDMMRAIVSLILLTTLLLGCNRRQDNKVITPYFDRIEMLSLHNLERGKRGVGPLEFDPILEERAQKWAEYMASRGRLTHSRLDMGGTTFRRMGENIAMGHRDVPEVVDGWMDSSGHRRNILNKQFSHAGFGYALSANGMPYWCAQFGGE